MVWGSSAQWLAYLLWVPAALGLIPSIPTIYSEENIINAAEVNQWYWLEESRQWLGNVDRAYFVLAGYMY